MTSRVVLPMGWLLTIQLFLSQAKSSIYLALTKSKANGGFYLQDSLKLISKVINVKLSCMKMPAIKRTS